MGLPPAAQTGLLSLPPGQGGKEEVSRGEPSPQTGGTPPQLGVLPSEQGPAFTGAEPSEQTGLAPSSQVGGPLWPLGGLWGLEPSAQAGRLLSGQEAPPRRAWATARRPRETRRIFIPVRSEWTGEVGWGQVNIAPGPQGGHGQVYTTPQAVILCQPFFWVSQLSQCKFVYYL